MNKQNKKNLQPDHGFIGTRDQLANALYECGDRNGATASAICKTAADLIRAPKPSVGDQEWCQPGDIRKRQFIVTFDDPECRNAVFDDEEDARRFWAKASLNWNCYLFGTLTLASSTENRHESNELA